MKEYTFGGRPFLLDEPQMTLLRENVYEDLAQNGEMLYPHVVAPADGEESTAWLPLTTDEVRALIDNGPEALCPKTVEAGSIKKAAPRCYVPLAMTLLNGGMQLTTCETLLVPAEDFAFLVCQYIKADELCLKHIESLRPVLYESITARLPEEYGQVNFPDVEAARVRLNGFEWSGDEVREIADGDKTCYHVLAQAEEEFLELYEETIEDIVETHLGESITIEADYDALKRLLGAEQGESIIHSLQTLFQGGDVRLTDFARLLEAHGVKYERGKHLLEQGHFHTDEAFDCTDYDATQLDALDELLQQLNDEEE